MTEGPKYYAILDNGGHPFVVKVSSPHELTVYDAAFGQSDAEFRPNSVVNKDEKAVDIYKRVSKVDGPETFHLFHPRVIAARKIFVPKGEVQTYKDEDKTYYNKLDDEYDGNSILVETGDKEYTYIGPEIVSFSTADVITDYRSPVGNSAVPYPFAVGAQNYYLMAYDYEILPVAKVANKEQPYDSSAGNAPKLKTVLIQKRS